MISLFVLVQYLSKILFVFLFRIRVYGIENLPKKGGVLIASNHQSYLDPVLVGSCLHKKFYSMARKSLFKNPLFSRLITLLYAFPVKPGKLDRDAMEKASALLRGGEQLIMFPEGTRTRDGSIGRLRGGAALIAKNSGVPIVPAVISGAFEIWPRNRKLFRFGPILVAFAEPVVLDSGSDPREATRKLEETMKGLKKTLDQSRTRLFGTACP